MIRKGNDVKLNVKPMFVGLYHKAYYEGPCRFGRGEALEVGYDKIMNQELFKRFVKNCEDNMPEEVNILEPLYVERTDDWDSPEELFEKMIEGREDVDLYFFSVGLGRGDIMTEFATRYQVPVALDPTINFISGIGSMLEFLGIESYVHFTWEDMRTQLRALRARKAIQKMRMLTLTRSNSITSLTGKFGVIFRARSIHEFMDQMEPAVEGQGNPTTPGRQSWNIDDNDMKEVERISQELMAGADEVDVNCEYIENSVRAFVLAKKYMDLFDCNAFAAPCPEACSTTRLNSQKFTFCLNHSLMISEGLPSACEYDIDAAVSMMPLMVLSGKSAFMGNTSPIPYVNGKLQSEWYPTLDATELENMEDQTNLYFSQHSTPTLKMRGFDKETPCYALRHFAYDQGFGAILRYDYKQDMGETITLARFSPDAKKLFVGKGTIVASGGFDRQNCNGNIIFRVADNKDFANKQKHFGNHIPLVYGDYVEEMVLMGEAMGLEVVTA